ncbi:MAG: IS66 family insertion sequence element accessory protein TnpB [Chthoniobacter sp.]
MEPADRVLKQDAAGRVWTPPEQREAVLDEFERSGLPAAQFAARVGVKYQTLATWVQKRRKARSEGNATNSTPAVPRLEGWVEATVESSAEDRTRSLVVHLPGGSRLEVRDTAQAVLAAHLLRALAGGGMAC